ncbi:hypothetical protein JYT20_01350 [Rhodothermus sp. AH-315-K08]|nr:hypothetical protein [Rhodothermus sp. AH-315-K08]
MQQNRRFLIGSVWPLAVFLVMVTSGMDARAQVSQGNLVRAHWPDVLFETQAGAWHRPGAAAAENFSDTEVLAFMDTLALSWEARVEDERPIIDFSLSWVAGRGGILDGRIVTAMPDSIRLSLIDLHARVLVGGDYVGDLVLAIDSLWLPEGEFYYDFSTDSADWKTLFDGMDADQVREAFSTGFHMDKLEILRVRFDEPEVIQQVEREVMVVRRPPRRRAIFVPDVNIWIGWNIGRDPYRGAPRTRSGNRRPRGRTIGRVEPSGDDGRDRGDRGDRTTTTEGSRDSRPSEGRATSDDPKATESGETRRSGRSGKIPSILKGDGDDDDDDRDFLGPAVGAAAVIGALAYFGGTIGYFGYADIAPIGLEAGRVGTNGGILVHAAINSDVFMAGDDEQMVFGISGIFPSVFAGVRPMVGVDVWFREDGDSFSTKPTVTVGGLYRIGRVSLHAGADLAQGRTQMGIAVNFR